MTMTATAAEQCPGTLIETDPIRSAPLNGDPPDRLSWGSVVWLL